MIKGIVWLFLTISESNAMSSSLKTKTHLWKGGLGLIICLSLSLFISSCCCTVESNKWVFKTVSHSVSRDRPVQQEGSPGGQQILLHWVDPRTLSVFPHQCVCGRCVRSGFLRTDKHWSGAYTVCHLAKVIEGEANHLGCALICEFSKRHWVSHFMWSDPIPM